MNNQNVKKIYIITYNLKKNNKKADIKGVIDFIHIMLRFFLSTNNTKKIGEYKQLMEFINKYRNYDVYP